MHCWDYNQKQSTVENRPASGSIIGVYQVEDTATPIV